MITLFVNGVLLSKKAREDNFKCEENSRVVIKIFLGKTCNIDKICCPFAEDVRKAGETPRYLYPASEYSRTTSHSHINYVLSPNSSCK